MFDRIFNTRTKKFEQFTRCVHLLTLYDECLAENPPYIPKKFRENKLHVRNQREQEIVFNKSMSNLKCEYELLTSRKCEFEERFKKCDEEIHEHLLKAESINQFVKIEISRMWTSECKGKEENANNDWKKKLEGVKAGFVKDKIEFKKSTRFPINTIPQDDNENQPQHEERTAETSDAMSIFSQNSENRNSQNSNNTPTTTMNTDKDDNAPIATSTTIGNNNSSSDNNGNNKRGNYLINNTGGSNAVGSNKENSTRLPAPISGSSTYERSSSLLTKSTMQNHPTVLVDETVLDDTFEDSDDENQDTTLARINNMANNFESQSFRNSDNRDIPPKETFPHLRRSTRNHSKHRAEEKEVTTAKTHPRNQPAQARRTSYSRETGSQRRHLESDWRNSTQGRSENRRSQTRSPEPRRRTNATWSDQRY